MVRVFAHQKGGVGKSTLLFNYCIYEQSKGRETVIIDLDGQHSVSSVNELRRLAGLEPLNILTFSNDRDLINYLNENQDKSIVIDTGGFDSAYNRIAIAFSDLVIVPISDSPFEQIRAMRDLTKILDDIGNEVNRKINTYVILNRIHHGNSEKGINTIKASLNAKQWKFFDSSISDNSDIKFSPGQGKSLLEYSIKKNPINEMKKFFKELNKITKEL
jgi:chromosome partitioning protein